MIREKYTLRTKSNVVLLLRTLSTTPPPRLGRRLHVARSIRTYKYDVLHTIAVASGSELKRFLGIDPERKWSARLHDNNENQPGLPTFRAVRGIPCRWRHTNHTVQDTKWKIEAH